MLLVIIVGVDVVAKSYTNTAPIEVKFVAVYPGADTATQLRDSFADISRPNRLLATSGVDVLCAKTVPVLAAIEFDAVLTVKVNLCTRPRFERSPGAPTNNINSFVVVDITVAVESATDDPNSEEVVVAVVVSTTIEASISLKEVRLSRDNLTMPCSTAELNARTEFTTLVPGDTALTADTFGAPATTKLT